jgi:hypothetical protein
MSRIIDRFFGWMETEPLIGMLMIVTAIVLFATAFSRSTDKSNAFWPWIRRIIESAVGAVLFLGLLWTFRTILNNNSTTFNATHGSLSDTSLSSAQSIWGRPHIQRELTVNHFIYKIEQQEIPRENPDDPPKYKDVTVRVQVPQNSIIGFTGQFDMKLSEREKGYALYSGFIVDTQLTYNIINDSAETTEVDYLFPLSPGQTLFEGFKILFDGEDISSALRFGGDAVQWQGHMSPRQQSTIEIAYTSRGMNHLYYQIPYQRQITNFSLTLTVDKLPVSLLNYPEGILAPTRIEPTGDGDGSILTWEFDSAITTAGMGVALLQPEQPGAKVFRVLNNSPLAVTMLTATVAITLLLLGRSIHFLDLALLAGVYSVQFLIMAGISDYTFGFWGSLALGAVLTLFLTALLVRRQPKLVRGLVLGLVLFFTVVYPLAGLLKQVTDINSFDTMVQVGLTIYIVLVALYQRLRLAPRSETAIVPAEAV